MAPWRYGLAVDGSLSNPEKEIADLCGLKDEGHEACLLLGNRPDAPGKRAAVNHEFLLCIRVNGTDKAAAAARVKGPVIHGPIPAHSW